MYREMIIPAQIRAARALLEWNQDQLATAANVSVTTVRDFEAMRRSDEVNGAAAMRRALENGGVIFIDGDGGEGPGVRLAGARPNIIRRPTKMSPYGELPFRVEWRGRAFIVFVPSDVLEDLAENGHCANDAAFVASFNRNIAYILAVTAKTIDAEPGRVMPNEQLHLREVDFEDRQPPGPTRYS